MSDSSFRRTPNTVARARVSVFVVHQDLRVRNRIIAELENADDLLVVGAVSTAGKAVAGCRDLRPDVLVLDDGAGPRNEGVDAIKEIMAVAPTRILILCRQTQLDVGFDSSSALAAGAVDVLESQQGQESDRRFSERLLRAVRLVARVPIVTRHKNARLDRSVDALEASAPTSIRRDLMALGGSTGGPAAVADLLRALPPTFPLPILLVLHLGPSFGFGFAEWLSSVSKIPVVEATNGAALRAGSVHVCPPDQHLILRGNTLFLTRDAERLSCRPSVDVLFESVAESAGPRAIACLLTGIGRDGAEGLSLLRARGALTMAQDEESSIVFGMPREAIARGAAIHVLPPSEMALLATSAARIGRQSLRKRA
ncbi:MAG: chemotaxis protein CheB [Myxococcota bacterium]